MDAFEDRKYKKFRISVCAKVKGGTEDFRKSFFATDVKEHDYKTENKFLL